MSILRTQVGKVLDQKDTYDWALKGEPAEPLPAAALEPAAGALAGLAAALLIRLVAAEMALARLGLAAPDALEGATRAARGDEAAALTTDEARLVCWTGRVWM